MENEATVAREIIDAIKAGNDGQAALLLVREIQGASEVVAAGLIRAAMRHVAHRTYKKAAGELDDLSQSLRKGVQLPHRS